MKKPLVTIQGTWDNLAPEGWWSPLSTWAAPILTVGYEWANPTRPFMGWTCRVEGVMGKNYAWISGGQALAYYIEAYCDGIRPTIIAHSHGGQLPAYCFEKLDTLLTVGTPVREDVPYAQIQARRWIHLYAAPQRDAWGSEQPGDVWQYNGGGYGPMPLATANIPVEGLQPRTAHGDLLNAAIIADILSAS